MSRIYRFANRELHSDPLRLLVDGQPVEVGSQSLLLLQFLLQHPGELVEKSTLLQEVWGHHHLTDAAYARAIMRARQAVGDDGKSQQVIRTVHGRGVMLVASVVCEEIEATAVTSTTPQNRAATPSPMSMPTGFRPWPLFGLLLAVLFLAAWQWRGEHEAASTASGREEMTVVLRDIGIVAIGRVDDRRVDDDPELIELQAALPGILDSLLQLDGVHLLGAGSDSDADERAEWMSAKAALPAYFGADAVLDLTLRREGLDTVIGYHLSGEYPGSAELVASDRSTAVRKLIVSLREQLTGLGRQTPANSGWTDDPLLSGLVLRGHSAWARGETDAAIKAFDAALAMAPEQPLLRLWRLEIDAATSLAPVEASRQLAGLADQHATLLTPMMRARVLERAGTYAWYAGDAPRASAILEEALRLASGERASFATALVRNALAMAQQSAGMHEQAWENGSLAVDALRSGGHRYHLAFALSNLGYLAEERGRVETADLLQREALQLRGQFGFARQVGASAYAVARTARRRGQLDEAQQQIQRALDLFSKHVQRYDRIDALEEQAEIHLLRGDFEAADMALDLAAAAAAELDDALGAAWIDDVRGRLRIAQDRALEAVPLLQLSVAVQIEQGEEHESRFSRIALADALDAAGQRDEATSHREALRQSEGRMSHDQQLALSVIELRAARRRGDAETGSTLCDSTLELTRISGTIDREAEAAVECGQLHLAAGRIDEARYMGQLAARWNASFAGLRQLEHAIEILSSPAP